MAKELPYFKFYTSDWSNGDITLETYELQGLFINICAYYWSKDCKLSLINLVKKFRFSEDKINELLGSKILKVDRGGNIIINFLIEQMGSKEIQKITNQINGKKGGRPALPKLNQLRIYLLRCSNENEHFLKLGVTSSTVKRRYSTSEGNHGSMPYNYTVVFEGICEFDFAITLEKALCNHFIKYTPKINFGGSLTECFIPDEAIILSLEKSLKTESVYLEKPSGLFVDNQNHNPDITNIKERKGKKNNTNSIELRKKEFSASLIPFLEKYGKDMLNDFYTHWSEPNKSGTQFRQELERTWDTAGRLRTWAKREKTFVKAKPKSSSAVDQSNNQNLFQ